MTHAEISKGVINIEQEKTYKVAKIQAACLKLFHQNKLKKLKFHSKALLQHGSTK